MTRRRRIAVALAGLFAVLAVERITRPFPCAETFRDVKVGMTRGRAEFTAGGPPGEYGPYGVGATFSYSAEMPGGGTGEYVCWKCPDGRLAVGFDRGGIARFVSVDADDVEHRRPLYLTRLRARLGL